jgi:hypothetical protein
MSAELDALLSRPLADVPDGDFSARTLAIISERNMRRARIEAMGWIVLVLAATAGLAASRTGRDLAVLALSLGMTVQIGVILSVVLVVFALRETAE